MSFPLPNVPVRSAIVSLMNNKTSNGFYHQIVQTEIRSSGTFMNVIHKESMQRKYGWRWAYKWSIDQLYSTLPWRGTYS